MMEDTGDAGGPIAGASVSRRRSRCSWSKCKFCSWWICLEQEYKTIFVEITSIGLAGGGGSSGFSAGHGSTGGNGGIGGGEHGATVEGTGPVGTGGGSAINSGANGGSGAGATGGAGGLQIVVVAVEVVQHPGG
jgi:hypothetical protein